MAPARKRRRLPTLIDRGIGLLEVILPGGSHDDPVSSLPPGQRDPGGFWFPAGYVQPGDIFTLAQRKLQAKQRQVQRHRHKGHLIPPPIVSGSDGTSAADTAPSRPHAPPVTRPAVGVRTNSGTAPVEPDPPAAGLADQSLPLPAPCSETSEAPPSPRSAPGGRRGPSVGMPVRAALPAPERARVTVSRPVVDSHKGSD
jgi:hypothetical protein